MPLAALRLPADTPEELRPVVEAAGRLFSRLGGCALLVGVEDYGCFDPTGARNLRAGRNDALVFWKVCRRLGYRFIRVLTSPRLTREEIIQAEIELSNESDAPETAEAIAARVDGWNLFTLPPEVHVRSNGTSPNEVVEVLERLGTREMNAYLGEATAAEIQAGTSWLADKLGVQISFEWKGWRLEKSWAQPGLFTYSGHGARRGGELFLCPSDTQPSLQGALSFSAIREVFEAEKAEKNLTVVLDCCFAGSGKPDPQRTTTSLSDDGSPVERRREIAGRVFCAAPRDERAHQAVLGGRWHGAFTWACTVALEQWKTAHEDGVRYSTVSHAELLVRARMLLSALSFRQHPVLVDDLGDLPLFRRADAPSGTTSAVPTADRPEVQADPTGDFAYYAFKDVYGTLLAELISNKRHPGMLADTEYWRIPGARFDTEAFPSLRVEQSTPSQPPFDPATASFTCAVSPQWTATRSNLDLTAQIAHQGAALQYGIGMRVTSANGIWTGEIRWVTPGTQRLFALDGETTRGRVTEPVYSTSQTPTNLVQPGARILLQGPNRSRVTTEESDYARWTVNGRTADHTFVRAGGVGALKAGDTVLIRYLGYSEARHLSATTEFNLRYLTNAEGDETWTIVRATGASGPIQYGEVIRFYCAAKQRYLSQESDGYLGSRSNDDPDGGKNLGTGWILQPVV